MKPLIRVLVVDDSPLYRAMLCDTLKPSAGFQVVATAENAQDAREKIKQFNPDVVTLDVEMPEMNGIDFLEKIMTLRPMPVVMVSTLTGAGTDTAIRALEIGALDCVAKPSADRNEDFKRFAAEVIEKVTMAAQVRVSTRMAAPTPRPLQREQALLPAAPELIAIGSSTGGVEALASVLPFLPANSPPIVVVQHMPAAFTRSLANRLGKACTVKVQEAYDGAVLTRGQAWIAPGGHQMIVQRQGKDMVVRVTDDPPVNKHAPSVDVLFHSLASLPMARMVAVILTGMGKDGAEGMLALRQKGAQTIAQDEATCIVYGMPRAAVQLNAAADVLPLQYIASKINTYCFGSAP